VVIVGAGEVGFHIAGHLSLENKDVVVIDRDPEAVRRITDHLDVQGILGSGSSPVTLEAAGLKGADIMLAVTNSDEVNLVACMVSDIISPATKKLARVRHADYDPYFEHLKNHAPHIDTLINPEIEVVKTILRLMQVPGAVDVGEFADGRVQFVGIHLDEGAEIVGTRLADMAEHTRRQMPLIAAVVRKEELIIPRGEDRLLAGDLIYFISEGNRLADTLSFFDKHAQPVNRALIVGGGRIGYRLARELEATHIYTKIIERDEGRCLELAERLNKAVVLHGDGSDKALLLEENISDIDMVVTLTNDEETNILVSLMAREMGARKTITQISKFSYFPLMATIGLEQVVSSRLSAINSILQHIRLGKVISAISIKGEQAEVMEAVALETSDIVGKALRKVSFPKGALVAGIIRGEQVIIPTGESVIVPEDRIIIFAQRQAIPKVEKILAVKLEYF
jgi:trk system potassium uptake protein TrkA